MWEDREFRAQETKEEEKTEIRKKRINVDSNIKAAKKQKELPASSASYLKNIGDGGTPATIILDEAQKPIPKGALNKLKKISEGLDAFTLDFQGALAEAAAEDVSEYISKKQKEKANISLDDVRTMGGTVAMYLKSGTVGKSLVKEFAKTVNGFMAIKEAATETLDGIHDLLNEAKADRVANAGA